MYLKHPRRLVKNEFWREKLFCLLIAYQNKNRAYLSVY